MNTDESRGMMSREEFPVMFGYDGYQTEFGISPRNITVWLSHIDFLSLTRIMTYRAVDDKDMRDRMKVVLIQVRSAHQRESHRVWLSEDSVKAVRLYLSTHAQLGERMAIRHG